MIKQIKTYLNRGEFATEKLITYGKGTSSKIVSDIGAGYGHMKNAVISTGAEWQPFDYVQKIEEATIWNLDEKAPINVKKAHVVLLLEVLEHLNNPLLGIGNIANHMHKDGILILTVPNPQSSKNTISLFLNGALFAFQEKHINENHVFTPWKHIVYSFLERSGFEVLEYAIVDIQYKSKKNKSFKDWLKSIIESYIEFRNPLSKGMSYGIVAKKR